MARRDSLTGLAVGWTVRSAVRVAWWAVKLPLKALLGLATTTLALLGEEAKRWLGILTGGALLAALTWLAARLFAWAPAVVLTVLLLDLFWVWAVANAAHKTAAARLAGVRTREMYRRLDRMTTELPGQLQVGLAAAQARGDAAVGWFRRAEPYPTDPDTLRALKELEAALADQRGPQFEPIIAPPPVPTWARRWGRGVRKGWRWGR